MNNSNIAYIKETRQFGFILYEYTKPETGTTFYRINGIGTVIDRECLRLTKDECKTFIDVQHWDDISKGENTWSKPTEKNLGFIFRERKEKEWKI